MGVTVIIIAVTRVGSIWARRAVTRKVFQSITAIAFAKLMKDKYSDYNSYLKEVDKKKPKKKFEIKI